MIEFRLRHRTIYLFVEIFLLSIVFLLLTLSVSFNKITTIINKDYVCQSSQLLRLLLVTLLSS